MFSNARTLSSIAKESQNCRYDPSSSCYASHSLCRGIYRPDENGIVIEGSVVGYELYLVKPTLSPLVYPVFVKLQTVVEGKESSQYVLVGASYLEKEIAEKKFGRDNISSFRVVRQPFCAKKSRSLFNAGLTLHDGKAVKTDQTFTLVPGVSKKDLSLQATIPCYFSVAASDSQ